MTDANIMNGIARLLENNIAWRLIGKKRKPQLHMEIYLESAYKKMIAEAGINQINYQNNRDIFKNMVSKYESQYWDMSKYKELLYGKDLTESIKIHYKSMCEK